MQISIGKIDLVFSKYIRIYVTPSTELFRPTTLCRSTLIMARSIVITINWGKRRPYEVGNNLVIWPPMRNGLWTIVCYLILSVRVRWESSHCSFLSAKSYLNGYGWCG